MLMIMASASSVVTIQINRHKPSMFNDLKVQLNLKILSFYKHLDMPKNYYRILFVDFSSAFNTIQPHLINQKLNRINLNKIVIKWIFRIFDKKTSACEDQ